MPGATVALLAAIAFLTALLSGIFGMAGGLLLMGALAWMLPVSAAFVTHGILQVVANGWRAVLHRRHIRLRILGNYAIASVVAGVFVSAIAFMPSRSLLFLLLGLVAMLVWLPKRWLHLDAEKTPHALASGFLVTLVNLTAGVAGPLLDVFFVRTALTRHEIVATKAATQVFSHAAKIAVYGAPLLAAPQAMPPWWAFALAISASIVGTALGARILDRISDVDFKRWTAWIVTAIGLAYLAKAAQLMA